MYDSPTVRDLARALEAREPAPQDEPPLIADPAAAHEPFEVTDVQAAYLLGREGAGALGDVSCYAYGELRIPDLDPARLEWAMAQVIAVHPMLRAGSTKDARQRVLAEVPAYRIAIIDLSGETPEGADERLGDLRRTMSHQVLPADRWPLFDVRVARLPAGDWRLHFGIDLLISDAVSIGIVMRDLLGYYFDAGYAAAVAGIAFRDVVQHQHARRATARYRKAEAYWLARLEELPPAPALPTLIHPDQLEHSVFSRRHLRLAPAAWGKLQRRAREAGVTPTVALLTAYAAVLAAWSASDDFSIQLTVMDRKPLHPDMEKIVGDFTTINVLEVRTVRSDPFAAAARRLQDRLVRDLDHLDFSGVAVLRERVRRHGAASPAHVVFTSALGATDDLLLATLTRRHGVEVLYAVSQTPQVMIDCQVSASVEGLSIAWDVPQGLFPDGVVDDMFAAYGALVERLADEAAVWSASPAVLPAWQRALLEDANATTGPLPSGSLQDRVFAAAERTPAAIALMSDTATLDFATLTQRALVLERRLSAQVAPGEELVAILMDKGWEAAVAAFAILEAGLAFLPVPVDQPAQRIATILRDAGVRTVLAQPHLAARLTDLAEASVIVVTDEDFPPMAPLARPERARVSEQALAYVIYTSGSTGVPKGVMISHHAARNTLDDLEARFALGSEDRVLWLSELSFDLAIFDLFGILGAGGTVVIPPPGGRENPALWAEAVERHGVTVWNSVPALAEMALTGAGAHAAQRLDGLRLVMLSGDWIPLSLPERLRTAVPGAVQYSLGGATEASIWSILYRIDEVDPGWRSVPYGKPLRNQTFHVLKSDLTPCPVHVPGKLFIGGVGVALGYWHDPEKTAARFVIDPATGRRLYDTGDLGRYLPSGDIELLGRDDFQVKIRGHRVELGEIEAALGRHPMVETAVVVAAGDRDSRQLVAYVVPKAEADLWDASDPTLIHDPVERMAFTLRQPGLAPRPAGTVTLALPGGTFDEARRAAFLARQSYRRFAGPRLTIGNAGRLARCDDRRRGPVAWQGSCAVPGCVIDP